MSVPGCPLLSAPWFVWSVRLSLGYKKRRRRKKKKEKKKQHSNRRTVSLNGTGNKAASSQKRVVCLSAGLLLFWQDKTHTGVDSSPPSSSSSALLLSSPPPLLLLRAQPSCFSSGSTLRARTVPPRHTAPPWRHGWWVAGREGGEMGGDTALLWFIHYYQDISFFSFFLIMHLVLYTLLCKQHFKSFYFIICLFHNI